MVSICGVWSVSAAALIPYSALEDLAGEFLPSSLVVGLVLTSAHSSGTYMASMYCLLCRHADPDLTPHRLLHTSSSICLPSQTSQLTVYGNTEIKVASVALSNFTSTQFQGRDLVCPWPGLAVLVADPLNRC